MTKNIVFLQNSDAEDDDDLLVLRFKCHTK